MMGCEMPLEELQRFDAEALAHAKSDLDKRKDALRHADQAWRERSAGKRTLKRWRARPKKLAWPWQPSRSG
ncbi:hypothetical protein LDC_2244 [sediment metagenome]|uniref:Uncharacterized protein n=1 Tax=sediment metagenome TaxID=749907 RepID=D9PL21_9ZZZZ